MGKKRKAAGRAPDVAESKGWNERGGKLDPINTYEDVADSEDEFHINRDKIMLDDGPDAKRRRKWEQEDAILQPSDEEVLGYSTDSEEEQSIVESDAEDFEDDEDILGNEKYGGDAILTEKDAEDDEKERRRLQRKQLKKMTKEDFGFEDEDEWLDTANKDDGEDKDVVTEVLQDIEITPEMTPDERLQILRARYPEFDYFADEFVRLDPVFEDLRRQLEEEEAPGYTAGIKGRSSTTMIKGRALAAYTASLAMYFALFTSPAQHSEGPAKPMDPEELHDHPVMETILKCREVWERVKSLKAPSPIQPPPNEPTPTPEPMTAVVSNDTQKKSKKQNGVEIAARDTASRRAAAIEAAEEGLADLSVSSLLHKPRKSSKKSQPVIFRDDDSDFGEETHLSAKAAAEKAQKKKSLRFHTSQIVQKSNKRAAAGRDAGGDTDLPHKERLRDRQARLNAEAEKRGKKLDEYGRGADLSGQSEDEDIAVGNDVRGEEDEYYDMVVQASKKKKLDKAAKSDAIKQAKAENGIVRVVEGEVDEDGKRAIGYVIEKNKGLAPKRKKDVRNPRVKKRKKYEEKKKKLGSTRAVYKGGEGRGGYGGEKTGIKTGLVKSIKL